MKTSINLEVFLRVFYQKKHVNALITIDFQQGMHSEKIMKKTKKSRK